MQYEKRLLIPPLTSNTSNPDFQVESSSEFDSSYQAWKAFNGTTTNADDCWASTDRDEKPTIIISFSKIHYIYGYKVVTRNTNRGTSDMGTGDWKVYISTDKKNWKEQFSFGMQSEAGGVRESYLPKFKAKYIKIECLNASGHFKAIGELNFFEIKEFYAIQKDEKYYSFNESQYDEETKSFKEITLDDINNNILKDGILSEKNYLFKEITVGDETFKPIDKFSGKIRLVSVEYEELILNAVKSKEQLVKANGDFTLRTARNIDKIFGEMNIPENCSILTAISTDSGVTWKTTKDRGVTWESIECTIESLSQNGMDISDFENINFNNLHASDDTKRLIRLAYLLKIDNATNDCNISKLSVQFDTKGKFRVSNNCIIEQSQDFIFITPNENMDIMKINVGTGGNLTVQEITNNNVVDYPTDEEISNMVSEVMSDNN